jgi:hypothetical protein
VGIHKIAAMTAGAVLGALMIFQLLLALGLPFGRFAWGGEHPGVLPANLRWSSLVAILILALAAWVVLARADLVAPGSSAKVMQIAVWVFTAYFTLNTVMNVLSKSPPERYLMTPASTVLVVCFFIVARS